MKLEIQNNLLHIQPESLPEAFGLLRVIGEDIYDFKSFWNKAELTINTNQIDKILISNKQYFIHLNINNTKRILCTKFIPETLKYYVIESKFLFWDNMKWTLQRELLSAMILLPFLLPCLMLFYLGFIHILQPDSEVVGLLISHGYLKLTSTCNLECINKIANEAHVQFFKNFFWVPIILASSCMFLLGFKFKNIFAKRMTRILTIVFVFVLISLPKPNNIEKDKLFIIKKEEIGLEYKHLYITSKILKLKNEDQNRNISSESKEK